MNEEHRDLLERCRRDIIRLIVDAKCLDDILDELGKKDENGDYGLTRDNIARIKGGRDADAAQQVRNFLDILPTRGEYAFERFKKTLIEINQIGLISIFNCASGGASSVVSNQPIQAIQQSLREMYLEIFHYVHPISVSFAFDIENNWIPLAFKLDDESTSTEDHIYLLNTVFSRRKMLILEGDPGTGKTSLLRRIAYEWAQNKSELIRYDLVLYAEFRNIREEKFKNILDLVKHDLASHLEDQDYKRFENFISNVKYIKEHKILILLDGYDESSLKEQCAQLSDYLYSSTASRPLLFNVLITSRKGYLSELHKQKGRYSFADIFGFTTTIQKKDYIVKYFTAENGAQSTEIIEKVNDLLKNNANLQRLANTPLLLSFICVVYNKMKEGSELELYMNIIWWLLDRHQRDFPDRDIPGLLGFQYDMNEDKLCVIENNYRHFPQLHLLGKMGMEDIFKSTFTETDLERFKINPIIQQVGLLSKEKARDDSFRMKTEYSFPHRTIQEFISAFVFFYCAETPSADFWIYFVYPWKKIGRGIVQVKLQSFMNMISNGNLDIESSRKATYSKIIEQSKYIDKECSPTENGTNAKDYHENLGLKVDIIERIPKSSEEAITFLKKEADQGNIEVYFSLGVIYYYGILIGKNDNEAVNWCRKAAEQGLAKAQNNLGFMYEHGLGVPQSNTEAEQWYQKAAEQGELCSQINLTILYDKMQGAIPQSDEEAFIRYKNAAEEGDSDAQYKLGFMYYGERGVRRSYEEGMKWHRKSAEQGNVEAQYKLAFLYQNGLGVRQSYEEAVKWYKKAAEQGHYKAQLMLQKNELSSAIELSVLESAECNTTVKEIRDEYSDLDVLQSKESKSQADIELRQSNSAAQVDITVYESPMKKSKLSTS